VGEVDQGHEGEFEDGHERDTDDVVDDELGACA
jgi:hypothetical protein